MRNSRGDTLVEVLLATVVLSIVLSGAYTLSTRATLLNRTAYERSSISALLQQQAELIRSLRESSPALNTWQNEILNGGLISSALQTNDCKSNPDFFDGSNTNPPRVRPFHIDGTTVNRSVKIDGFYYIWVQAVSPSGASYIDFHINACWENTSQAENLASGLVVRLQRDK